MTASRDSRARGWTREGRGEPARSVIFGEALFDNFPDGGRALGGAPFNVAWHLQGFRTSPLLITAVGDDAPGREIVSRMEEWGMDTAGVQIHPERPTGEVQADVQGGEVEYRIEPHQAYDAIREDLLPPSGTLAEAGLLYHGTLALREDTSRDTLDHLRSVVSRPVLLDVNLRAPWWTPELVEEQLKGADRVKMNREEALLLAGEKGEEREHLLRAARSLQTRFGIRHLAVTLGSRGALGLNPREAVWQEATEVEEEEEGDTVGAGDAFSAVLALGIHREWSLEALLRRATGFAAELCRVRGATPADPDLYEKHLGRWEHDA